jgi:hypothetical protein
MLGKLVRTAFGAFLTFDALALSAATASLSGTGNTCTYTLAVVNSSGAITVQCSANSAGSPTATLSGTTANTCVYTSAQLNASGTLTVQCINSNTIPASQSITFGAAPTDVTVGGTALLSSSASSGLPVIFSSITTGACRVSGNTVTGMAAGTCIIAANQAGDSNYSRAAQVVQSFSIGAAKVGSTNILSAQPTSPASSGQATTLTDKVSGVAGTPTGNVTFKDGSTDLATVALNASGTASYATNFSAGSHTLTARYTGNSIYLASQGNLSYVVKLGTTTTLSIAPRPSHPGEAVTITVKPSSSDGASLSGTVNVSADGQSCAISLPANSCRLLFTRKGAKNVTATYSGNGYYSASSGTKRHYVGKLPDLTPSLLLLM